MAAGDQGPVHAIYIDRAGALQVYRRGGAVQAQNRAALRAWLFANFDANLDPDPDTAMDIVWTGGLVAHHVAQYPAALSDAEIAALIGEDR